MPLRTVVKVGNISNLNDARYCAGMGVDMLGFCVTEGQPGYIHPDLFQEIRGWISGPKIVAETYGPARQEDIARITENYHPDYLEMDYAEYKSIRHPFAIPCLVSVSKEEIARVTLSETLKDYLIITSADLRSLAAADLFQPVLVRIGDKDDAVKVLSSYPVNGIVLDAQKPGLADILESLEEQ